MQALELDPDYLTHINYAVTLVNNDEQERAREHFQRFKELFKVRTRHVEPRLIYIPKSAIWQGHISKMDIYDTCKGMKSLAIDCYGRAV